MKYVDEYRDPQLAKVLSQQIKADIAQLKPRQPLQIMEFCGGHTHTIFRYGIENLLPDEIELIHGPGCPVCVLPRDRIDEAITLAERDNIILTTFGDVLRVPGSTQSLAQAKARGADIRSVYSPLDALAIARKNPNKEIVFFAIGFETTMPNTALTVLQAQREERYNLSLLCNHVTTFPVLRALLETDDSPALDAFIAPGHVATVVGANAFNFVAADYCKPLVISGFEPLDLLQALSLVIKQFIHGRSRVENQYTRFVTPSGNKIGQEAINRVFEARVVRSTQAHATIKHAGVGIRKNYADFDAEQKFRSSAIPIADITTNHCEQVLIGKKRPTECALFGNECQPNHPQGALMVSSEGACAAYFRFSQHQARESTAEPIHSATV